MAPSGEPKDSPKPQPIGASAFPLVSLFTVCTLCVLFILWRRADSLRTVVAHQLKTWVNGEGRVRLSEDDGPPSHSFIGGGESDDEEDADDEPLAARAERLRGDSSRESSLSSPFRQGRR
ncbi:hypothetical protein SCHPADRAFT_899446 [Schizopora paradoxa]|uniref:Uncharacterized protein n=1 Tax=Schizopora paradoxa TaxID=27342 RepID=A0A0H2SNK9_9AGAM|nr:hypothetical protein SCHPADRAFT_899446 [Schizopora paradoxa]